jgi:hypothetical protein
MSFAAERWLRELALGLRVLRKDRGFTVTAVVTLAVCLGGHAAIVAGVNAMLFHPLRVPEPDRVLLMANQYPLVEARRGRLSSTPDYDDRLRHVTAFQEQAFYNYYGATIETGGVATRMRGMVATPSLLRSRPPSFAICVQRSRRSIARYPSSTSERCPSVRSWR